MDSYHFEPPTDSYNDDCRAYGDTDDSQRLAGHDTDVTNHTGLLFLVQPGDSVGYAPFHRQNLRVYAPRSRRVIQPGHGSNSTLSSVPSFNYVNDDAPDYARHLQAAAPNPGYQNVSREEPWSPECQSDPEERQNRVRNIIEQVGADGHEYPLETVGFPPEGMCPIFVGEDLANDMIDNFFTSSSLTYTGRTLSDQGMLDIISSNEMTNDTSPPRSEDVYHGEYPYEVDQALVVDGTSGSRPLNSNTDPSRDDNRFLLIPLPANESSPTLSSPAPSPATTATTATTAPELYCLSPGCNACFTGEYRKGNLSRHRRNKHGGPDGSAKTYYCESGCHRKFRRKDARLKHVRKHHPASASVTQSH